MSTCYHCADPVVGQAIDDAGAVYHPACYATAAYQDSCSECGAAGPDAFVIAPGKSGGHILPMHVDCIQIRARRLAVR